jgi:hypothetical protein
MSYPEIGSPRIAAEIYAESGHATPCPPAGTGIGDPAKP